MPNRSQSVVPGLAIALVLFTADVTLAQQQPKGPKPSVSVSEAKATKGYTLVAPMNSTKVYLIDLDGSVVKTWETGATPGASTYLLENGNLLRTGNLGTKGKMNGAASGGRVIEMNWDGDVVWDYTYTSEKSHPHHDICKMPNGNVLLIVWDKKTKEEAIAAGRLPGAVRNDLLPDAIIEVKPTGKTTGDIVWEWHAWDHLIQDADKTKANYGNVSQHPELIDVNFGSGVLANLMSNPEELKKLQDIGYVGGPAPKGPGGGPGGPGRGVSPDWMHTNAIAYNPDLDQIMLSIHEFSELWIIDHGTTTKEAAGHTGGKAGKGGDLLYRWGNPKAYRGGSNADQRLFAQHNAHWIPKGCPGEGNIIIFNNGTGRPGGQYSSVDEIVPPLEKDGKYTRKPGLPYGPTKAEWSYSAEKKSDFFANFISGAHRLPNGNTLVCSGPDGTVFEVTAEKQTVWKFQNPSRGGFGGPGGPGGFGMFIPPPGTILPPLVQDQLKLTSEQKKQMDEIQKEVDGKLEQLLTEEQRKQFKEMKDRAANPFGGFGPPGGPGGGPIPKGPGGPGPGGLFRAYRYPVDFPAFKGKELKPGVKIEEIDLKK